MKPTDHSSRRARVSKMSWIRVPVDVFTFGQRPVLLDVIDINLEHVRHCLINTAEQIKNKPYLTSKNITTEAWSQSAFLDAASGRLPKTVFPVSSLVDAQQTKNQRFNALTTDWNTCLTLVCRVYFIIISMKYNSWKLEDPTWVPKSLSVLFTEQSALSCVIQSNCFRDRQMLSWIHRSLFYIAFMVYECL